MKLNRYYPDFDRERMVHIENPSDFDDGDYMIVGRIREAINQILYDCIGEVDEVIRITEKLKGLTK